MPKSQPLLPALLTRKQAAAYLGFTDPRSIEPLLCAFEVIQVNPGRKALRIVRRSIDKWIEARAILDLARIHERTAEQIIADAIA